MIHLINNPKIPPWHITFPGVLVTGDSTI
jgi:hypothetical protein